MSENDLYHGFVESLFTVGMVVFATVNFGLIYSVQQFSANRK